MLYSQNLQEQSRIFFQNGGGGAPGAPILDPPLHLPANIAVLPFLKSVRINLARLRFVGVTLD